MTNIIYTKQQEEIIKQSKQAKMLMIKAFAGTGKTTTLVGVSKENKERNILYLAFNKVAADDARERFPENTEVRTIHSLALSCLKKVGFYVNMAQPYSMYILMEYLKQKNPGKNIHFGIVKQVFERLNLFFYSEELKIKSGSYIDSFAKDVYEGMKAGEITTGHDGYLKVFHEKITNGEIVLEGIDIVMLDEAQDSNPVTIAIFNNIKTKTKILVGDPYQQIYAWRGSKNAFSSLPRGYTELSLTQTYRYPRSIAQKANLLLRRERGERNEIETSKENGDFMTEGDTCVICRTNSGIIQTIIDGMKKGIRYKTLRPAGEILKEALDILKIKKAKGKKVAKKDLSTKEWSDFTYSQLKRETTRKDVDPRLKMAFNLVEKHGSELEDVTKEISNNRRKKKGHFVFITTVHTAKGLEWDKVILNNDFTPYLVFKDKDRGKYEEEVNLYYVAMTRAKEVLEDNTPNLSGSLSKEERTYF
jgi:superfamily I DNA/RNA helicase